VGLRAGLDTEARGKILSPLPGIERQDYTASNEIMMSDELERIWKEAVMA
jgi:hypothetical protein